MTVYAITTANWNDWSFWSYINESGAGQTLDFSALPSTYWVTADPSGVVSITDVTTKFTIGEAGIGGPPAISLVLTKKCSAEVRATTWEMHVPALCLRCVWPEWLSRLLANWARAFFPVLSNSDSFACQLCKEF